MEGIRVNKSEWPKLVAEAVALQGALVDEQIRAAISKGQLISSGAVEASSKYACYELRIGTKIQQLVMDGNPGPENDLYRERNIPDDGIFTIKPGGTFKIYAIEELYMPSDVFALIIPVGNLYKLGLNPETSFADPGFAGAFYVTVCNYSPRIVKLRVGDALARIFFFPLSRRPDKIHDSKPRDLPPAIERVKRPTEADLLNKGETIVLTEILAAVDPPHYEHAFVTHRLVSLHRRELDERLIRIEGHYASITLVSLVSLLAVLVIGIEYAGSMFNAYFPAFFHGVAQSLVAAAIWGLIALGVPPIRRAFLSAVGLAFRRGA
jgi:deoxycytidine triphosphate deaminase